MEINEHIEKNLEDLRTPLSVIIAFESEEGYNRALAINDNHMDIEWLGLKVGFDAAPEPTDIIWENRQFTHGMRIQKLIVTVLVTLLLLGLSLWIIFTLQFRSHEGENKYEVVDC